MSALLYRALGALASGLLVALATLFTACVVSYVTGCWEPDLAIGIAAWLGIIGAAAHLGRGAR